MTDREVMKQALEAYDKHEPLAVVMEELRAALEQQAEPVAWMDKDGDVYPMPENKNWAPPHTMLYTAPPQRTPLTGEQIEFAWMKAMQSTPGTTLPIHEFARAIEQARGMPEQSIDDLVAEFEATPKGAEAMRHGREWVKDLQSEQPVGHVYWAKGHAQGAIDDQTLKPGTPLYASPTRRKPLTDEEIAAIVRVAAKGSAIKRDGSTSQRIARAIEAAHGIRGEA